MKVSVVVPLYNKARYVARALDSILKQDYGDFELIVVDDGSTDESPSIVRSYTDKRIRLISQANAGPGAARNYGVSLTCGEILAFCDADDEWFPWYLSENLKILDAEGPGLPAISWALRQEPGGLSTGRHWEHAGISTGIFRVTEETKPETIVALLGALYPTGTVFRKTYFEELGGFYGKDKCRYSEDAHLFLKLMLQHPYYLNRRDGAILHVSAAELSANHTRVRPIEPFLTDPDDILAVCPEKLKETIRKVFAMRAIKTAAVYGYWGQGPTARRLLSEHIRQPSDWRLPYVPHALLGCTPVGGWLGALSRTVQKARQRAG